MASYEEARRRKQEQNLLLEKSCLENDEEMESLSRAQDERRNRQLAAIAQVGQPIRLLDHLSIHISVCQSVC